MTLAGGRHIAIYCVSVNNLRKYVINFFLVILCVHLHVHDTFSLKMVTFSKEKHWGISTE